MQLVLQTNSSRWSLTRPAATTRTKIALAAGVALAGAGLVTAGPLGINPLPTVQHHEVQLVDVYENPINPATVFTDALSNIQTVQTDIADVRLDDALTTLFTGYSDRLTASFEISANAFQEAVEQFPTTLQNALDFAADGQYVEAYSELNSFGLFGLEDIARPVFDLVTSRRGEGIINDLAQQTYNAVNAVFTRGDVSGFAKALLAPGITANFESALIAENVQDAINTGDYNSAFNDLLNAPSQILGAYLNGAEFPFVENGEAFPGLLTAGGPLEFFYVTIPNQIADAISPPVAAAASADAIDFGDWSALFDAGNWTALFDASALTDSVASAIDPGAVSDELTSLVTSIF